MKIFLKVWICLFLCLFSIINTASISPGAERRTMILAFSRKRFWGMNVKDAEAAIEMWATAVFNKKNLNVTLKSKVVNEQSDVERGLQNGEIAYALLSSLDYLSIEKKGLVEPLLVGSKSGKVTDELLLLVKDDSSFKDLGSLRGKKLMVIAGGKGELGKLWLDTLLLKRGYPRSSEFFSRYKETGNPSDAVLPVYFGQQDACIVTYSAFTIMVELNPKIGKKLRILASSSELLFSVLCRSSKVVDEELKQSMLDSALTLQNDPDGKQVLLLFQTDRLEKFRPSHLENIRELYREYTTLLKGQKK